MLKESIAQLDLHLLKLVHQVKCATQTPTLNCTTTPTSASQALIVPEVMQKVK